MDAVRIETLPTTKSLLSTDTTDISKEKEEELLYGDDIEDDDEIRLRLSDDEEIDQENTSEDTSSQQTNLQLNENDFGFQDTAQSQKDLLIESTLLKKDTALLDENDSSGNSSLDENINDSNINNEESIMSGNERIPPIVQNSPKYWNNFDKPWKGVNSSRVKQHFSHHNNWNNQQYGDKKYNNKNSFNSHNNHFNRRNNARNYNNPSPNNKYVNNKSNSEKTNNVNHTIRENGISDDFKLKDNNSFLNQNEKLNTENLKVDKRKTESRETHSDEKDKSVSNDSESLSERKCQENGIDSITESLKNPDDTKNGQEKHDEDKEEDDADARSIITKDCDDSMTETVENKGELNLEENTAQKEECSYSAKVVEKQINNDITSSSNNVELGSKEDSVDDASSRTSKIEEIISRNNLTEISIEVNQRSKDEGKEGDQTGTSDNAKDIDIDVGENNDSSNKNSENEIGSDEVVQDKDCTNNIGEMVENSEADTTKNNESVNVEMETSDINLNDNKNSLVTTGDNITDSMDVEMNENSNSILVTDAENKSSDSSELRSPTNMDDKAVEENQSSSSIAENSPTEEEKIPAKDGEASEEQNTSEQQKKSKAADTNERVKVTSIIEEVDLVDDDTEMEETTRNVVEAGVSQTVDDSTKKPKSQIVPISNKDTSTVEETNEDGRAVVHKRRRRKRFIDVWDNSTNEIQPENGVRQKRRSAKNAEEMIRKEILKDDEDDEDSSDESGKLVPVNYKRASAQPQSPPTLKRTLDELDCISDSVTLKRIKSSASTPSATSTPQERRGLAPRSRESVAEINELVRKMSQEDIRGKLRKLSVEDLEALLLHKIVESITIRGEMGKLREQARVTKRNLVATQTKCQLLQKQVDGFDMVLKRLSYDKNANSDKFVPPIKINRSVGLQVNFLSDHGIHNLKQIQALKAVGNSPMSGPIATKVMPINAGMDNRNQSPRKMLKTRSPRRPDVPSPNVVQANTVSSAATTQSSPASTAVVMNKSLDPSPKRTITLQSSNSIMHLVPPGQQQQTVVVNSTVGGGMTSRTQAVTIQKANSAASNKTSDLIDLTDEEDKTKTSVVTPITTISSRFPRVIQAVPASVAITSPTNLRLVQTNSGSPNGIVNNMNTPRLAYVMQSGMSGVPTRQLVLTSSNTIRPITSVTTRNISTISYKQGIPTLSNGTVRVLTTQAPTTNLQSARHPAPLPETPIPESNPIWKLPPPAPSLKISKVATGIVLSWNMTLSDKFAEIVSYQLYAYQEVAGTSPNATLWKKVGDVRALPLPMACTLTQFTEGNNYYFAVRAVDIHSRFGQYSKPGNISL